MVYSTLCVDGSPEVKTVDYGGHLTTSIYTLREVAQYLKVTERTVYRLLASRRIPAFKVGGSWRFRLTDLNAWIERQTAPASNHRRTPRAAANGPRAGAGRR